MNKFLIPTVFLKCLIQKVNCSNFNFNLSESQETYLSCFYDSNNHIKCFPRIFIFCSISLIFQLYFEPSIYVFWQVKINLQHVCFLLTLVALFCFVICDQCYDLRTWHNLLLSISQFWFIFQIPTVISFLWLIPA